MKISIRLDQTVLAGQDYSTIFLCLLTYCPCLALVPRSEMDEALAFLFS